MQHYVTDLPSMGQVVARLRKARGLTQKQLGALTGMGQSTLARFETGQVAEFGSRKLLRLLEALGHALVVAPTRPAFTLEDALEQKRREAGASTAASGS